MKPSPKLSSCRDFVRAFAEESRLGQWHIGEESEDLLLVRQGDQAVSFAWPSRWQVPGDLALLLEKCYEAQHHVLLMGTDEEFDTLPGSTQPVYQLVTTPISMARLLTTLHGLPKRENLCTDELKLQLERARYESELFVDIGRALSQERDTARLLELILLRARQVTGADAGSVYVVEGDASELRDRRLHFSSSQNDSRDIESKGFSMPVSEHSIVGICVLEGKVINIPDLCTLGKPGTKDNLWGFEHDRTFDQKHGYETRSMVTIPMISARDQVIGVIQLINKRKPGVTKLLDAKDFREGVMAFDELSVNYATTLASQACIALENSLLYGEVKALFDGFVHASVTAIEARDPTTSGHSSRVATLTTGLAKIVDRTDSGVYREHAFDVEAIRQIEYAALLHDFGKIGVREHVLTKPKKLHAPNRELIEARFEYIRRSIQVEQLTKKVSYLLESSRDQVLEQLSTCDVKAAEELREVDEFLTFILQANEPTVLDQGGFERLADIAARTYLSWNGKERPYLTEEEVFSLQVARGSLTNEEREEIQSHVVHTYNFLKKIPWGRAYRSIPQIAGAHHEKLDGSGYPLGLKSEDIPLPAKMMTISDIFDALTASDRPYKRAVPLQKALDILSYEVKDGKLDADLFQLFLDARLFELVKVVQ